MNDQHLPSLEEIARAGSVVASDALQLRSGLAANIRPVTSHIDFCGRAVTAAVDPGDNRAAYEALARVRPGDVLVISSAGVDDVAMVGGTLAGHCRNLGVVAIVTDGMVRDIRALERVGLPVWARGMTPNAPTKLRKGQVGTSITVGGFTISEGDIVVGDIDGIAIVPLRAPADFPARMRAAMAREAQVDLDVERGEREPAWLLDIRAAEQT